MKTPLPHISVCVCTFRRAELLRRVLSALDDQNTAGLFTYSIVVVDNDASRSGQAAVEAFVPRHATGVIYYVQPEQNIALARNMAVAQATGEYLAFIDDDELPPAAWLATLFRARCRYGSDGVLGPVKPLFEENPPGWVVKGRFYDRPSYPTGLMIDGKKGRTGNVLLKREVLVAAGSEPFRRELRTGEDQDFFSRMIELGYRFVWCHEAVAYEVVPPIRWKRRFMLRRALLRGGTAVLRQDFGPVEVGKSLVAVPVYLLALPFALLCGQHRFMNLSIKLFDHLGKLLAIPDWNPVREPYVTE